MTAIPIFLVLTEQVIAKARMNHTAAWVARAVTAVMGASNAGDAPRIHSITSVSNTMADSAGSIFHHRWSLTDS